MNTKDRDYYFDNLKGFLILSVIIGNSLELGKASSDSTHFFILFLYVFHMPLFAFVTGYFSKRSRRSTKEKVIDTVKLYIYTQVAYTFFNFFILGNEQTTLKLLMPQWTLWYLLSMIAWYLIYDYVHDVKKWIVGGVLASILLGFDASIGTGGSVSRTIFFLPFFLAGTTFDLKYINKFKKYRKKIISLGGVLTSILFVLSYSTPIELFFEYTRYTWYFDKPWFPLFMRVFHYLIAIVIGCIILMYIPRKKIVISTLGRYSLIMYISHSGICQLLNHFRLVNYSSLINSIISTFLTVGVVIVITLLYVNWKRTSKRDGYGAKYALKN